MTTPHRLVRYNALPKASRSTESELALRHPEINPEWVIGVIDSPHDSWIETQPNGESRTILTGRISSQGQWVNGLKLITAYFDKRLETKYGGRPWSTE